MVLLPPLTSSFTPDDATWLHDVTLHSSRTYFGSASHVKLDPVKVRRLLRNSIFRNSQLFGPTTVLCGVLYVLAHKLPQSIQIISLCAMEEVIRVTTNNWGTGYHKRVPWQTWHATFRIFCWQCDMHMWEGPCKRARFTSPPSTSSRAAAQSMHRKANNLVAHQRGVPTKRFISLFALGNFQGTQPIARFPTSRAIMPMNLASGSAGLLLKHGFMHINFWCPRLLHHFLGSNAKLVLQFTLFTKKSRWHKHCTCLRDPLATSPCGL